MASLAASDVIDAPFMRDANLQRPLPDATSPVLASPSTSEPYVPEPSTSYASGSARPEKSNKRSNPLIDLIETEKQYVDLLASIIRRVAGAWSKDNFPPKELDTMFRNVEAVYKANRALLARLKEIGPNPTSPKALGDLLMRWIDDLEEPYVRYCSTYVTGFNVWAPVQSNPRLPATLVEVSSALPPNNLNGSVAGPSVALWTLDALFLLPRGRLKYYKRLYTRLLKSTQPGRSDHRLLVGAVEKLDNLLEQVGSRLDLSLIDPAIGEDPLDDMSRDVHRVATNPEVSGPPLLSSLRASTDDTPLEVPIHTREGGRLGLPEPGEADLAGFRVEQETVQRDLPAKPPDGNSLSGRNTSTRTQHSDLSLRSDAGHFDSSNLMHNTAMSSSLIESDAPRALVPFPTDADSVAGVANLSSRSASRAGTPSYPLSDKERDDRGSSSSVTIGSSRSEGRSSRETASTSVGSLGSLPSASDLERKLSVERVYDIFTMTPKPCSLQMNPPGLPFARTTRASADVVVSCTPSATGVEVVTLRGHVLLMSDLVLICEKMTDEERRTAGLDGTTMWLVYPPLAGRFIKIIKDANQDDTSLVVQLLRKVTIVFRTESREARDKLSRDFEDCIAFASSLPSGVRSKPTSSIALPSIPGSANDPALPRSSSAPISPSLEDAQNLPHLAHSMGAVQPALNTSAQYTALNSSFDAVPSRHDGVRSASPPAARSHSQPLQMQPMFSGARPTGFGTSTSTPELVPPPLPQHGYLQGSHQPGVLSHTFQRPSFPLGPSPFSHPTRGGPLLTPPTDYNDRETPAVGFARHDNPVPSLPPLYPSSVNGAMHASETMQRGRNEPRVFSSPTGSTFLPPSARSTVLSSRSASLASSHPSSRRPLEDVSPPSSPADDSRPVTAVISAQMKCKVFLKQGHSQWKSLGGAKLKLYQQHPTNVKQLVVEADTKEKPILISTIVLTDAVERVGKTGVAIELSDKGASTGVVYMIQLRNEASATGLFNSLLAGSDRTTSGRP